MNSSLVAVQIQRRGVSNMVMAQNYECSFSKKYEVWVWLCSCCEFVKYCNHSHSFYSGNISLFQLLLRVVCHNNTP